MKKVTIYTTPTCTYCKMTKQYFKEQGVEYNEVDVSVNPQAAQEMIHKSGQMGVPVIAIADADGKNEAIVVGFDKLGLSQALNIPL
ncbi:MAG: glutaredoxin family protein [Parcubacteria group bacterium]|nr:glutaredoxin family protein [Parcubacteria group bacterium]